MITVYQSVWSSQFSEHVLISAPCAQELVIQDTYISLPNILYHVSGRKVLWKKWTMWSKRFWLYPMDGRSG